MQAGRNFWHNRFISLQRPITVELLVMADYDISYDTVVIVFDPKKNNKKQWGPISCN